MTFKPVWRIIKFSGYDPGSGFSCSEGKFKGDRMCARAQSSIERREKILLAAESIFLDCGYPQTTVDMIVTKTGVSKQTIYVYFKSKEEIFKSVIERSREVSKFDLDLENSEAMSFEEFFQSLSNKLAARVQSPEFIRFLLLITSESMRFPYLREIYFQDFVEPVLKVVIQFAERKANTLDSDIDAVALCFRGAITSFAIVTNAHPEYDYSAWLIFQRSLISSLCVPRRHTEELESLVAKYLNADLKSEYAAPIISDKGRTKNKGQAIISSALDLFFEKGFRLATMDEVSAKAAVSKATVYSHFENKESLFARISEDITTYIAQVLTMEESDFSSPREYLAAYSVRFLSIFADKKVRDYFRVILSETRFFRVQIDNIFALLLLSQKIQLETAIISVKSESESVTMNEEFCPNSLILTGALLSYALIQQIYTDGDLLDVSQARFLKGLLGMIAN